MTHGYTQIKKDSLCFDLPCEFFYLSILGIWGVLWRCTRGLSSISFQFPCVAFMQSMVQSMASTIALLLLTIASINGEKTLFYFHFTSILLGVIKVVGNFSFACWIWVFDKLKNNTLQRWMFFEKLSKFITFTWIKTVSCHQLHFFHLQHNHH